MENTGMYVFLKMWLPLQLYVPGSLSNKQLPQVGDEIIYIYIFKTNNKLIRITDQALTPFSSIFQIVTPRMNYIMILINCSHSQIISVQLSQGTKT